MTKAKWRPVCPAGHKGPWRYVEAIEVVREVLEAEPGYLRVNSFWETGDGNSVEDSGYLLCWAEVGDDRCMERVELDEDIEIDWE